MRDLADTGRVISGRYRLEAPIGRGAMGVVWRARDQLLDRDVAVKEVQIAETLTADERANAYQRTLREAKTAARLSHPGVVSVYDVADDGGRPWIVMELVNARSLDQVLAADGPLSPRQTADMGRQLLAALSVAHGAGVLHRDVKPSNVLLGLDGRAVLTDFGIATFQGDPKLTQTGMVMGSPGFTAPERIRGGDATPASDLWSLGATLYAAVQGHGPYEARGGAITTMSAIINEDAPAAPAAGALSQVIAALLRREPQDRPGAVQASRMISDVLSTLPEQPVAGGYVPTSLSATPPGIRGAAAGGPAGSVSGLPAGSVSGMPAGSGMPAVPEVTSLDVLGGAAVAPPTKPQPSLGGGAWGSPAAPGAAPGTSAGSRGAVTPPEPDFSSWYSPARPSERTSAGFGSGQGATDVASWPNSQPSSAPGYGSPGSGVPGSGSSGSRPGGSGPGGPGPGGPGPGRPGPGRSRDGSRKSGLRWKLALAALAIIGAGAGAATIMALRHNNSGTAGASAASTATAGSASGNLNLIQAINHPSSGPFPIGFVPYQQAASVTGTKAGFSLQRPGGWKTVRLAGNVYETYLEDPDANAYVLVDLTPHTYPRNMLAEARYIRNSSAGFHPGYQQLDLLPLRIRGAAGSYWKFTYLDQGIRQEVLDLLWVGDTSAGQQSYAMLFTAPAAQWDKMRPTFVSEAESFSTLPS